LIERIEHISSATRPKKKHKNAPAEMPSNKPVRRYIIQYFVEWSRFELYSVRLRINADNSTRKFRDPRFSDLSGKMNSDIFLQSYKFLDEYQVSMRIIGLNRK
jgi:hypothetical protein